MKNLISFFVLLVALGAIACQQQAEPPKAATAGSDEALAITQAVHGFFRWYAQNEQQLAALNFVDDSGDYLQLDEQRLEQYMSALSASGFVSDQLIAQETQLLRACAEAWKNESKEEVPSCLHMDRFYCAQDYIAPYDSGTVHHSMNNGRAYATLLLSGEFGETRELAFELVPDGERWLLAKLGCESDLDY